MAGLLDETVAAIGGLDEDAIRAARLRQDSLTKPQGSLGRLEDVSVRLAGIAGQCPPPLPLPAVVAVFAADHGVHAQGVSPWPQEVTAQMVANFLAGGAAVNAIAAQAGADVRVVDIGVATSLPAAPGLLSRKVRAGTADMTTGPAMSAQEALRAIETGIEIARGLVANGHRCLITGDMGIANTTASAALIAAFTGTDPAAVTGRGTGIDDPTLALKVDVIRRALALHSPDPADPLEVLARVGGLEHAALVGFIARRRGGASSRAARRGNRVLGGARRHGVRAVGHRLPVRWATCQPSQVRGGRSTRSASSPCSTWGCASARDLARSSRCRWLPPPPACCATWRPSTAPASPAKRTDGLMRLVRGGGPGPLAAPGALPLPGGRGAGGRSVCSYSAARGRGNR